MSSRLGPRVTRAPPDSRDPIARSLWPDMRGATSGSRAARSVDRSTSMYARTAASLADQTVRSARPRPFSAIRTARTPDR